MTTRIRSVFFDLGGTLFSYRTLIPSTMPVLLEAAKRLGSDAKPRDVGMAYSRSSKRAYQTFGAQAYYLHKELFLATYREFATALEKSASDEFLEWIYEEQRKVLIDCLELRADCVETLKGLREKGLYLSIVSNIDDDHLDPLVERGNLAPHLDHWTSSEEAQSCKPHAGFFELALEKAGCEAAEVLFVGDSPEHDIQGARRMGMTSVLIEEAGSRLPLQLEQDEANPLFEPHHRITELAELLDLVD